MEATKDDHIESTKSMDAAWGGGSSKGRKRVVQLNSRVREVVRTRRHPSKRCRHAQIEKVERILNFGIVNIKTQ